LDVLLLASDRNSPKVVFPVSV